MKIILERDGQNTGASKRAMELLDDLGAADRANNRPSMVSGGQQQRVALARAFANRPRVILADKPAAALDSHPDRQVMELFVRVAHEPGAVVIVVRHHQRALDVFDRIHEMEDGELFVSNHEKHGVNKTLAAESQ